ncbi:hypothetical protein AAVH_21294 [Aphelenchoides avenae]|nr:hypothetical protein AAVH_21294 [Aphelenchus avenae]
MNAGATVFCDETLLDALSFLPRADLDAAQIAKRCLRKLVRELRFVCLRPLEKVSLCKYRRKYKLEKWFVARIQFERKPPCLRSAAVPLQTPTFDI